MLRKINGAIEKDQIKGEMMPEALNSFSDSLSQIVNNNSSLSMV
jgi:hypothetical protein